MRSSGVANPFCVGLMVPTPLAPADRYHDLRYL